MSLYICVSHIGNGDGGACPPTFMGHCLQKNLDILIEQSGSRYSNRAVTAFREAV